MIKNAFLLIVPIVKTLSTQACDHIEIARMEVCRDMTHLEQSFQNIIDQGGEGIILRDPDSAYQAGRSPGYLKHKARKQKKYVY